MPPRKEHQQSIMTLADLCRAIEEHQVRATIQDGTYVVRGADLRRLARSAGPVVSQDTLASRRTAS